MKKKKEKDISKDKISVHA